jgi:hypothetical protein
MRKNISLVSFVCLPLLACGGSDSNTKTVKVVDAKTFLDGSGGSGSAACLAQATYANLGSGGRATDHAGINFGNGHVHYQTYQSLLNSTDYFAMILEANGSGGAWSGTAIGPVVADLASLPGNLLLPELEMLPMAKFGSDNSLDPTYAANESYVAFAGTVNYTAAGGSGGTMLTGTLTNVQFDHVHVTNNMFADPGDMCSATIASASFSAVLGSGAPAAFQDGQTGSFEIKPPAGWEPRLSARHF